MVDLGTATPTAADGRGNSLDGRVVRRRRPLPGGRAAVGGFLVAASAVGVFAAVRSAGSGPDGSFVVVREDVGVGERLDADDLAVVALDLPLAQRRVAFTDPDALAGTTALTAMTGGSLVQTGDVARPEGAPELAQVSLPVEAGAAFNGDERLLGPGERVDVLVTYADGGDPSTSTVTTGASVVRVFRPDEAVGSDGAVVVVLAVPPGDLEAVAEAGAVGQVTLARTTGLARPAG